MRLTPQPLAAAAFLGGVLTLLTWAGARGDDRTAAGQKIYAIRCVACHYPMRGREPRMLRARGNELCLGCHKDKQGPFLFEHGAVSDTLSDGCLGCHMPHGSSQDHLLRYAGRGTCLQCHSDRIATGPTAHFAGNCTSCHVNVHGSNRNPQFFP